MKNKNYKELVNRFLSAVANNRILRLQGEFIPFFVVTDWLKYYDKNKHINNIYPVLGIKNKTNFKFYVIDGKYAGVARDTFKWHLDNEWSLKQNKKDYDLIKKEIDREYENYFNHFNIKSDSKTKLKLLSKVYNQIIRLVALTLYIERLDKEIISEVLSEYNLNLDEDKILAVSEIIDFIPFETKNNKFIIDVLKKKENLQKLQHVYSDYTYVGSKDFITNEVSKLDLKKISKDILFKEKQIKANKMKKDKLKKSLNKKEKKILDFINFAIYCRDDRKEPVQKSLVLMYNIAREIIFGWGIDKNKINNCLMTDILKGKQNTINKLAEVSKREIGFVFLLKKNDNYEETFTGILDAAKIIDSRLGEESSFNIKEIKGHVGSKGHYKGRVKIILNSNEHSKFKDGEILVTGMTRPEFVPLMKKSGAIITDEGGVTSHAAIVSRELGKPCIIGTKIATDILKDGMLVEVDANKGIVKILRK